MSKALLSACMKVPKKHRPILKVHVANEISEDNLLASHTVLLSSPKQERQGRLRTEKLLQQLDKKG